MYQKSLFAALVCVIFIASSATAQKKVPVKIFYESLCPDSIRFFKNQLHPVIQNENLTKYMDLELLPYGKSTQFLNTSTARWVFECHHGPNECYANKVQACAMSLLPKPNNEKIGPLALKYVDCLMTTVDDDIRKKDPFSYPKEKCANDVSQHINPIDIGNCANNAEGESLLSSLGKQTISFKPELKNFPTIVFENAYNDQEDKSAKENFKGVLCSKIEGQKPQECNSASRIQFTFITLACVLISKYFL